MLNKTRILALCVMAGLFSVIAAQGQHFDTDGRAGSADREAAAAGGDFDLSWYTVDGGGGDFVLGGRMENPGPAAGQAKVRLECNRSPKYRSTARRTQDNPPTMLGERHGANLPGLCGRAPLTDVDRA